MDVTLPFVWLTFWSIGINGKKTRLKLTTMHSSKSVDSLIVNGPGGGRSRQGCCHYLARSTFQTKYAHSEGQNPSIRGCGMMATPSRLCVLARIEF